MLHGLWVASCCKFHQTHPTLLQSYFYIEFKMQFLDALTNVLAQILCRDICESVCDATALVYNLVHCDIFYKYIRFGSHVYFGWRVPAGISG